MYGGIMADQITRPRPDFHSVKTNRDNAECCITGICMPSNDTVVIVDQSNMKLKLLWRRNLGNVIDEFPIRNLPVIPREERELYMMHDVCGIKRNGRFAVTVSKVQQSENGYVYFMRVTQGEIHYDSHSECQHDTRGLAYYKKHLYVGSKTDLYKYVVERMYQGAHHPAPETIYHNSGENGIFVSRIAVSSDMIYITDFENNHVVKIDNANQILSRFHMPFPVGVCIADTGTALVCGLGNELLYKTPTRDPRRIVFNCLSQPASVFHDRESRKIIIGGNSSRIAVLTLDYLHRVEELP